MLMFKTEKYETIILLGDRRMINFIEKLTTGRLIVLCVSLLSFIFFIISNNYDIRLSFLSISLFFLLGLFLDILFFPVLAEDRRGYVLLKDVADYFGVSLGDLIKYTEGRDNHPNLGERYGVVRNYEGELIIPKKNADLFVQETRRSEIDKIV